MSPPSSSPGPSRHSSTLDGSRFGSRSSKRAAHPVARPSSTTARSLLDGFQGKESLQPSSDKRASMSSTSSSSRRPTGSLPSYPRKLGPDSHPPVVDRQSGLTAHCSEPTSFAATVEVVNRKR